MAIERCWSEDELLREGYEKFPSNAPCRNCKQQTMYYANYGDDVYEDYIYRCSSCGYTRIVEGADS